MVLKIIPKLPLPLPLHPAWLQHLDINQLKHTVEPLSAATSE